MCHMAKIRNKLNCGEQYATTTANVRKRSDAGYIHKQWAIRQHAKGVAFRSIQEELYVCSRGTVIPQGRNQLKKKWSTQVDKCLQSRRLGKRKRATGVGKSATQCCIALQLYQFCRARNTDGLVVTVKDVAAKAK